jgi:hypothetical protein
MAKSHSKKITTFELIKIEKRFNGAKQKYFYNLGLEGIEGFLLLESEDKITDNLVGMNVKYKLNEENIVVDFDFV